jgi:hypothetical protein
MHGELCMRFIGELRQAWRRDVNPPDGACRTLEAKGSPGRSIGSVADQCFNYIRVGHDCRRLRFDSDGWISQGAAACEMLWWMQEENLVIADPLGSPTCSLKPSAEGYWEGRWLVHEQMPVRLYPVAD